MKKIIYSLSFIFLLIAANSFGQNIGNLDGIYYQAVALDDDPQEIVGVDVEAKPLFNREIGVRFTITKGLDGDIQWQEEHVTTTDKYGLFTLTIGQGSVTSTAYVTMLEMPWIDADQFLKVEIATKNDGNYKMVANQKFMAVPYAFYTDDIADDAITTAKILNEEVLSEDIKNETILADDINTGAVETSEILDETIIADDIATGAVRSDEILDETIVAADIAEGAVATSEILDETVVAADIATGAVTSDEILDATIVNADIADNTINLNTKIADVGPNQILIGDTTANAAPKLKKLVGKGDINISQNADSVVITSSFISGGVGADGSFTTPVGSNGVIAAGEGWVSNNRAETRIGPDPDKPYEMGDILLISVDQDLKGCILSSYLESVTADGVAQVKVVIFNPAKSDVTLTTPMTFKFLHVK